MSKQTNQLIIKFVPNVKNIEMKNILASFIIVLSVNIIKAQDIKLPEPQKTGGMPLMEALAKRSTSRSFDSKDLTNQQISNLLWAAFGINRPDGKRTAPSARNFQETDIYVLLKTGVYTYYAKNNSLKQVSSEDIRSLGSTQGFVKDAPVQLILVANLAKVGGNEVEKINTANIDAGYISQNIYLFCASEGLATGARGMLEKNILTPKLKLNADQSIILAHSVGYVKK